MATGRQNRSLDKLWRDALQPFAEPYAKLFADFEARIAAMPSEELDLFRFHLQAPSTTNCWWATYQVVPILTEIATREAHNRPPKLIVVEPSAAFAAKPTPAKRPVKNRGGNPAWRPCPQCGRRVKRLRRHLRLKHAG